MVCQRPIHQCQCEICQLPQPHAGKDDHNRMYVFPSRFYEQERRWYVTLKTKRNGHGGIERLARFTGMNVNTIRRGRRELDDDLAGRPTDLVCKPGGGRKPLEKSADKEGRIKEIVAEEMAGLPTDRRQWVRLSLCTISSRLGAQACRIGRTAVSRFLRKLGFGLVANRKSLTGAVYSDRNRQFGYIGRVRQQFLRAGYPAIRVDTTNKELVGNFANQGRCIMLISKSQKSQFSHRFCAHH